MPIYQFTYDEDIQLLALQKRKHCRSKAMHGVGDRRTAGVPLSPVGTNTIHNQSSLFMFYVRPNNHCQCFRVIFQLQYRMQNVEYKNPKKSIFEQLDISLFVQLSLSFMCYNKCFLDLKKGPACKLGFSGIARLFCRNNTCQEFATVDWGLQGFHIL